MSNMRAYILLLLAPDFVTGNWAQQKKLWAYIGVYPTRLKGG